MSSLQNNYEVVAMTETWLNENINSCELFDTRYNVHRHDRTGNSQSNRRGGGVLLAVDKSIPSERVLKYEINTEGCENIWVKLRGCQLSKKTLYLGLFYIPPSTPLSAYRAVSESVIKLVSEGKEILVVGDFNVPSFYFWYGKHMNEKKDIIPNTVITDKRSLELIDLMNIAGLMSYNSVNNHQNKTLDLVLSNIPSLSVIKGRSFTNLADKYHPPIEIEINNVIAHHTRAPPTSSTQEFPIPSTTKIHDESPLRQPFIRSLNYAKANFDALYSGLKNINWEALYKIKIVTMQPTDAANHCSQPFSG